MSSDLLDRYLDEVSGTKGRWRMTLRNNKDLYKTIQNSENTAATSNKKGQELKDELVKIFTNKVQVLNQEKEQLQKGIQNSKEIRGNIKDPEKKENAVCLHYPTGYEEDTTTDDLWKQVKDYIYQHKTDDITFPKQLYTKLVFDNTRLHEILETKKEYTLNPNNEINKYLKKLKEEFDTSDATSNETLDNAFESVFHWSFTSPYQLGLGGPNDLAEIFLQGVLNKKLKKDKTAFNNSGLVDLTKLVLDKSSFKPIYLELADREKNGSDSKDKFDDFLQKHDFKIEDKDTFYMDYDLWYGKGTGSDSYAQYKQNKLALGTSGAAAKAARGDLADFITDTGTYSITNDHYYAKIKNPSGGHCGDKTNFEVFMLVHYLKSGGKTYGTNDDKIFEQVLYNTQTELTATNDCKDADGKYTNANETQLKGPIIDNALTGDKPTIIESSQAGGNKRKQKGGVMGSMPFLSSYRGVSSTTLAPTTGVAFNTNSIYFDRKLMDNKMSENRKLKNLIKLYQEAIKIDDTEINGAIDKLAANAPLYYIRKGDDNILNEKTTIGGTATDIPTFEGYKKLITIANVSLNLGHMLKQVLYAVVKQYYFAKENVLKNMTTNKDVRRTISILDNLWEGLLKKYYKILLAIDNIFGKIPVADSSTKLNIFEIITGIQFGTELTTALDKDDFKKLMINARDNIKEYFPFIAKSALNPVGDVDINTLESLKKLIKLFYELPDLYSVASDKMDTAKSSTGKKDLKESRELLTLGGVSFVSANYEDLLDYATICAYAIDASKKSKETYLDHCKNYIDNIKTNLSSQEKAEILTKTNNIITSIMKTKSLDILLRQKKLNPDDTIRINEDEVVKKAFYMFARLLITDMCKKVQSFSNRYLRNSNQNIKKVESRVGNIEHSIYKFNGTFKTDTEQFKNLLRDKARIKYEAKAILRTLREKYVSGEFPQVLLRWTAEKIHNLIFELEMFSSSTLSLTASERRMRMQDLTSTIGSLSINAPSSNSKVEDPFQKCISRNVAPINYSSIDFWKGKEAIFNYLTRDGDKYFRIFVPVLQKIVPKKALREGDRGWRKKTAYSNLTEEQRKQFGYEKQGDKIVKSKLVSNKLLLVDIFALANKQQLNLLDKNEKIILLDDEDKYTNLRKSNTLNTITNTMKCHIWLNDKSNSEFGFQTYKSEEKEVKPIILIGNDKTFRETINGFKSINPHDIRSDYLVIITDENNENPENFSDSSIRKSCYDYLFKLPMDPFTLPGINKFTLNDVITYSSKYLVKYQEGWGLKSSRSGKQIEIMEKINKNLGYDAFLIHMLLGNNSDLSINTQTLEKGIYEKNPQKIVENLSKRYKSVIQASNIIENEIDIARRLKSIGSSVEMKYNKYNKERQDPEQRKRMNIDYYEVDAKKSNGSNYQTRFTSLSNIQKGFCWIEDIEYVSEIARQSKF